MQVIALVSFSRDLINPVRAICGRHGTIITTQKHFLLRVSIGNLGRRDEWRQCGVQHPMILISKSVQIIFSGENMKFDILESPKTKPDQLLSVFFLL